MAAKTYNQYKPEIGMRGPHPLDVRTIRTFFDDDDYGVYLVLCPAKRGGKIVIYVGRGLLSQRLEAHIKDTGGTHFYYKPLPNDDAGSDEECRLFHLYGKTINLDNQIHPSVPAGSPRSRRKCSQLCCNGEPN